MRHFILVLGLLLPCMAFSQSSKMETISLTQLANIIENTPESERIIIQNKIIKTAREDLKRFKIYEMSRDSIFNQNADTVHVRQPIEFINVHMDIDASKIDGYWFTQALSRYKFHNSVSLTNCLNLQLSECEFMEALFVSFNNNLSNFLTDNPQYTRGTDLLIEKSKLNGGMLTSAFTNYACTNCSLSFKDNTVQNFTAMTNALGFRINLPFMKSIVVRNNQFQADRTLFIDTRNAQYLSLTNNDFTGYTQLNLPLNAGGMTVRGNAFIGHVGVNSFELKPNYNLDWDDFSGAIINSSSYSSYVAYAISANPSSDSYRPYPEIKAQYLDSVRLYNENIYKNEIKLRGSLYDFYKSQHDNEFANGVYIELKDLETERLSIAYQNNSSFNTFFTWKINQFLKVFSAYGTQPSRAIVFSVYVIIAFAIVYLFFPNYWDSHGKNRIVDRYSFFLKYMKRDAGMQDVYLEEKKSEILAYQDYKELIESSGKEVPKFFQATALPIYKWAISGTKLTASLLSKVDVMKGTWSELPQSKRVWKSILLIGAFLIALLYDIFIKMLNALMLSINTFTTLGFGEIPIKGLPRYLAIIQGFIGWFMLTIFSVSLISQLLN